MNSNYKRDTEPFRAWCEDKRDTRNKQPHRLISKNDFKKPKVNPKWKTFGSLKLQDKPYKHNVS